MRPKACDVNDLGNVDWCACDHFPYLIPISLTRFSQQWMFFFL